VKTYTLSHREREATPGPWAQMNVERGANLLIPVPGTCRFCSFLPPSLLPFNSPPLPVDPYVASDRH
jgi:hypothetical protein